MGFLSPLFSPAIFGEEIINVAQFAHIGVIQTTMANSGPYLFRERRTEKQKAGGGGELNWKKTILYIYKVE